MHFIICSVALKVHFLYNLACQPDRMTLQVFLELKNSFGDHQMMDATFPKQDISKEMPVLEAEDWLLSFSESLASGF